MKRWILMCLLITTPLFASELVDVSEVTLEPGKAELQLIQEQGVLFAEIRLLTSDVLGRDRIPTSSEDLKAAKKVKKTLSKAKNVFSFDEKTKLKKSKVLEAFYTHEVEDELVDESEEKEHVLIVEYELKPVSKQDTITLNVVLFDEIPSLERLSVTIMNLGDERQVELTPSQNAIQL
jgi:hypothetical protein